MQRWTICLSNCTDDNDYSQIWAAATPKCIGSFQKLNFLLVILAFFVSLVPMYTFWVEVGISSKENTESDIFCFELKSRNSNFFPGIAAAHACVVLTNSWQSFINFQHFSFVHNSVIVFTNRLIGSLNELLNFFTPHENFTNGIDFIQTLLEPQFIS